MSTPLVFNLALMSLLWSCGMSDDIPEQIHIAYTGDPSEMIVSYVTRDTRGPLSAVARYGKDAKNLHKTAKGKAFVYHTGDDELVISNVKVNRNATECSDVIL